MELNQMCCIFFFLRTVIVSTSLISIGRGIQKKKKENVMRLLESTVGFVLQGNFHLLYQQCAVRACNGYVSKN